MRRFVLSAFVLCAAPGAFAAGCGSSPADKNCVDQQIRESKIVLPGNVISDPGNSARKEAQQQCCFEKATAPAAFERKFGEQSSTGGSSGGTKSK